MLGIIMAGGKSSRFGSEKLIENISGKKVIEITIENMKKSKIGYYVIAVSKNCPKTFEYLKKYEYIETPGIGYPEDVNFLLKFYRQPILILNGDSIFVTSEVINNFLLRFKGRSMAAVVSKDNKFSYIGLNIAVPGDEEDIIVEYQDPLLALNINTPDDLKEAMKFVTKL